MYTQGKVHKKLLGLNKKEPVVELPGAPRLPEYGSVHVNYFTCTWRDLSDL